MKSFILIVVAVAVLTLPRVSFASDESLIDMPGEWDSFYIVMLKQPERPDPNKALSNAELKVLMYQHIQYQLKLQKDSKALAGGGFAEIKEGNVGLTLLNVETLEEAEHIANQDPAVAGGHFHAIVYQWYVPAGRL